MSSLDTKPTVRWRFVSEYTDWMCWEINGVRIIVHDPTRTRKNKAQVPLDDRVISILHSRERKRKSSVKA